MDRTDNSCTTKDGRWDAEVCEGGGGEWRWTVEEKNEYSLCPREERDEVTSRIGEGECCTSRMQI